ncbi:N-acetylneuraminate synthase [Paenibacillus yonginensis]|uniref:N-acetylneuraminate synthase n=1 Tax=Paenibacillus yonginensis TaxID=1462996 RepID=A0A1B1N3V3_9BACL|nr:N-acetylneuraminate synthase family protein [Paenibacillus yonginensis]ANS76089.1 N-acetylneuraminate synthase [Paenibacillus yonginensis]
MTEYKKPYVIAEVGCNHKGELKIAKEMIQVAATHCKVDAVKFQKRNPKELLTFEEYNAPHPNPYNSYGNTYGEHREFLEFTVEQHEELMFECNKFGVDYSTSVWDLTSAKEIAALNPKFIKIPSASNLQFDMLTYLSGNYSGDIHLSFGMTTPEEEEKIIDFFEQNGKNKNLIIYSCVSGYPVPFEDLSLLDIVNLKEKFAKRVKAVGFSGHHNGIAADVAAFTLGAQFIERHFTLNRTWKGTDHAASLEPGGMLKLVRDLNNVCTALTFKREDILDIEKIQRKKLKKNEL